MSRIAEQLRSALGAELRALDRVRGGCIHETYCAELRDGQRVFAKASGRDTPGIFEAEAEGLRALAANGSARVPAVLHAGPALLILEWIDPVEARGAERNAASLARALAELHRTASAARYGFAHDNYLGATPQPNAWRDDWPTFWAEMRLEDQLRRARSNGFDGEIQRLGARLLARLEQILGAGDEKPALIHGDLWSGNFFFDGAGAAVLVDPACSYSSREAEFGMLTLFGGLGQSFYDAYDEAYPRAAGADERIAIYRLHHLLNHLNLFGASYAADCLAILRRFAGDTR